MQVFVGLSNYVNIITVQLIYSENVCIYFQDDREETDKMLRENTHWSMPKIQ